jgi:tetratricopeptide (TPR) repeat protein
MARAEWCEGEKDFEAALEIYRALEPWAPTDLELSSFITQLLRETGKVDEAIAICQERLQDAREAEDLAAALRWLRSMIECDSTRVDFRQEFIETAIEDGLSPELFREVMAIIDTWIEEEECGLAREALDLLVSYLPTEVSIQKRLWRIADQQGDGQAADEAAARLIELCREAGDHAEAIAFLESLPHGVDHPDNLRKLAQCQFDAGQVDTAVETLQRLADHLDSQGEFEPAEAICTRIATWQPDEPSWKARQARCRERLGDAAQALTLFEQAGMDLLSQGRLDEASEAWTQALAIDAAATDVAQLQHGLLNQLGRADEASALLQGTVDYLRQNRTPREAAEFFIGCLGTLELPVDPALALADLWAEAEETDRALEVLGHGLERAKSEKNIPGQVRIAERWIELDSHSIEIIAILAQHGAEVSAGQEHRDLLVGLGEKRIEESDWDSAAEIFRKLFEAHPDDAQIQDRLIRCHEGRGDPDEANRLRIAIAQEHLSCERWSQCQETLAPLVTDETTDADVLKMVFRCHVEMLDGKKASEIGHRLVDQAEAADDLQTAIDLAAEVSQLRPKDTGWARRLLDLLLTLAPNDRTVRADAIQALTALEDHEGAKRQRLTLAALHRDAGDPAAAEAIYRHILDTDATCAEASEGLLELHLAQGNTEAAVAFLWERAAALADGDQADDAVRTLRRLLELDGHHTEARRRLADLLRSQMRNDEAVVAHLGSQKIGDPRCATTRPSKSSPPWPSS